MLAATKGIGAGLSDENNRCDAEIWSIVSCLGLASVPIDRTTQWPNGTRTQLQPTFKAGQWHYANALAIECTRTETMLLPEEVHDFNHEGTSYRILRNRHRIHHAVDQDQSG